MNETMPKMTPEEIVRTFVFVAIGGAFVSALASIIFQATNQFTWTNGTTTYDNISALGANSAASAIFTLLTLFFVIIIIIGVVRKIRG